MHAAVGHQRNLVVNALSDRQPVQRVILAALLHGSPAAAVSQSLQCGTRNGITELSQMAPPIFGRAAIRFGIVPHSSFFSFFLPVLEVDCYGLVLTKHFKQIIYNYLVTLFCPWDLRNVVDIA